MAGNKMIKLMKEMDEKLELHPKPPKPETVHDKLKAMPEARRVVCRVCGKTAIKRPAWMDEKPKDWLKLTRWDKVCYNRRTKLFNRLMDLGFDLDNEDLLLLEGPEFDRALVGVVEGCAQQTKLCYDKQLCVKVLMGQGMNEEDAWDYFYFNTIGAWMGEGTPLFISQIYTKENNG